MQEQQYNIITKYLSNEASKEELSLLFEEMKTNKELKSEFEKLSIIWKSLNNEQKEFDKEKMQKLIALKISINKKQKQRRLISNTLKYAAIFILLISISTFVFKDLKSTKIIVNNSEKKQKIKLPDNSIVFLNKNTKIEYSNSTLKSFNREINIEGEAFFEIAKYDNNKFIVHTPDFNINVLGTKFNVRTYNKNQSVVLTEGKVLINSFKSPNTEITMQAGEILQYSKLNSGFILNKTNSKIYTSWLSDKLEFDNFSLYKLSELIKLRYNKDLIIKNEATANMRISGTAPSDDISLIIRALETILKTKIQQKENQLLIK